MKAHLDKDGWPTTGLVTVYDEGMFSESFEPKQAVNFGGHVVESYPGIVYFVDIGLGCEVEWSDEAI